MAAATAARLRLNAAWTSLGLDLIRQKYCTRNPLPPIAMVSPMLSWAIEIRTKKKLTDMVPLTVGSVIFRLLPIKVSARYMAKRSRDSQCHAA